MNNVEAHVPASGACASSLYIIVDKNNKNTFYGLAALSSLCVKHYAPCL
jgi:hypothetical protein